MFDVFLECWKWLSRAVFPRRCVFCKELVGSDLEFCGACAREFDAIKNERVIRFDYGEPYFDACVAMFCYASPVSDAIRDFKFRNKWAYAATLAYFISSVIIENYADSKIDCLMFVPERDKRVKHSEMLAACVSKSLNIPFVCGLVKLKLNQKQHKLNLQNRLENIKGAYALKDPGFAKGRTVLLIDDIVTTGSTLNECSRVLKLGGASKVLCATIAATADPNKKS
ncbi:MAG: double zinc ribbon domain-containing protein [Oscillospiraceae bacterium]|jgi:ComF family protein|nr:double zinc ribbon domain-containing protein [Oscillospiraceae bacterium]